MRDNEKLQIIDRDDVITKLRRRKSELEGKENLSPEEKEVLAETISSLEYFDKRHEDDERAREMNRDEILNRAKEVLGNRKK